jgi:hypothetical protein
MVPRTRQEDEFMSFFSRKKVTPVSMTFDVIQKCRCVACSVQATSECAKPKLASRKDMMENPASMLSQIMTPGMMKNLDIVKNMGNPMGMSRDQMKAKSDEMMGNTSKEQIEGMAPKPDDMPGPYCANGASVCKDFDYGKSCMCVSCQVYQDSNLSRGKPGSYFCRDGKPA